MDLISFIKYRLRTGTNQELSQSLVRAGLVVVVSLYLVIYYNVFPDEEVVMPFVWAVIFYFAYCVILVIHILLYPHFIPVRHYFTIIFDMALLCVGMYAGGVASAFFYGGYFWLILGNGLRFGKHSLHLSVLFAIISFIVVISITPFWKENIVLGIGLIIWLLLLPPYIGNLIRAKEKAMEKAILADDAKSRFVTNMSHELRTPLNAIIGYSQMIIEDDVEFDEARYASQKIDKAAQHLLSLINELLDIASIESGKIKINSELVELYPIIEEVQTLASAIASERNVTIETIACDDCVAYVDRLRFKQILINLVSNAIKYNKEKGKVTILCTTEDAYIKINVHDTGPGLSREEQSKLFKPFERLSANSANVEGAGIGLMLTRNLVEMMNGEIGFSSIKNHGSSFWIKLPRHKPETS